jgi:hypothetical protein
MYRHRQLGDLVSLLLLYFFKIKKVGQENELNQSNCCMYRAISFQKTLKKCKSI